MWAEVCKDAKCSILHHESNAKFDAYLLSESSLFIFPDRMIAKTCGQTTLLNLIPHLFTLAEAVGTRPTVLTVRGKAHASNAFHSLPLARRPQLLKRVQLRGERGRGEAPACGRAAQGLRQHASRQSSASGFPSSSFL